MGKSNATLKAFRKFARAPGIREREMQHHVNELLGENDRAAAILGGTLLDVNVEAVLKRHMGSMSAEDEENLFSGNGPLATFSARIRIASAFGLINADQRSNLDYVRELRNAFAHSFRPMRFADPEVRAVCDLFRITSTAATRATKPKIRFVLAVMETGSQLAGLATVDLRIPVKV
jgi:hypothetical protein